MLKRCTQANFSTNWNFALAPLKSASRGKVQSRPAIAPINAKLRASLALRSSPVASTTRPAMMGTQMARLKIGKVDCMEAGRVRGLIGQAQSRRMNRLREKNTAIIITTAYWYSEPVWNSPVRRAIQPTRRALPLIEKAVDDADVADAPQAGAEQARTAGEKDLVETVEAIFVCRARCRATPKRWRSTAGRSGLTRCRGT